MTVAVVSLALALAAGIAAIAWLARKLESALHGQVDANRLFTDEKRVAEEYLAQRDAKEVRISELTSLNTALKQRNHLLEQARNDAYDQAVKDVKAQIMASPIAADAAAVLDRILSDPMPGLSVATETRTDSDRGAREGELRTAISAVANQPSGPRRNDAG